MTNTREPYADELPDLFSQAIELDADSRDELLRELQGSRPALAARLEELLAADRDANTFLEHPFTTPGVSSVVAVGDVVEGFLIESKIASGSNGSVFRAKQDYPRRVVALKILHFALPSEGAVARFRQEVRTLARLSHPGIVPLFAAGVIESESRALPWFAMELIEGARNIREWGRDHSIKQRVAAVADACDAVHHAHLKQVIHRDLKPGNILMDASNRPRVIDFGVARSGNTGATLATHLGSLTPEGMIVGTLAYMSPEQLEASSDVDARTDLYALGLILYELCTGRLPYQLGSTAAQAMRAITLDAPLDPVRAAPHIRELRGDLAAILLKAIERDPARRYLSAPEFAADLRHWMNGEPVVARRPRFIERSLRSMRRRPVATVAIALSITTVLGITVASLIGANYAYNEAMRAQRYISGMLEALEDPSVRAKGKDARVVDAAAALAKSLDANNLPLDEAADKRMIAARMYELVGMHEAAIVQYKIALDARQQAFGATSATTLEALSALARAIMFFKQSAPTDAHGMREVSNDDTVAVAFRALVTNLGWDDPRTIDAVAWSVRALEDHEIRTFASELRSGDVAMHTRANYLALISAELARRKSFMRDPQDGRVMQDTADALHAAIDDGRYEMLDTAADLARNLAFAELQNECAQIVAIIEPAITGPAQSVATVQECRSLAEALRLLNRRDDAFRVVMQALSKPQLGAAFDQSARNALSADAGRILLDLSRAQEARELLHFLHETTEADGSNAETLLWRAVALATLARCEAVCGEIETARATALRARRVLGMSDNAPPSLVKRIELDLLVAEQAPPQS